LHCSVVLFNEKDDAWHKKNMDVIASYVFVGIG
jgi:hypothetical protein